MKIKFFGRQLFEQAPDEMMGGGGDQPSVEDRIQQSLFGDSKTEGIIDPELIDDDPIIDPETGKEKVDDPELEPEDEPKTQPDGDDDVTLASVLGVGDDALAYDKDGNVVFNATVDGQVMQVPINDLVSSYQLSNQLSARNVEFDNQIKEFEQNRDQAYTVLADRLQAANSMIQMAEQALTEEFNGIDWNGLRYSDPAEWAAQRQLMQERIGAIEQAKRQVKEQATKANEEYQQAAQTKRNEYMQQEINKMVAANPTWSDQEVMAKEVHEIGQFLGTNYGFKPEEIASVMDSRLMKLVQDAHAFHSGKQGIKDKRIPDNVPKFRKSGNNSGDRASLVKARQVKAQKQAIRNSGGSIDAVAASLIERM